MDFYNYYRIIAQLLFIFTKKMDLADVIKGEGRRPCAADRWGPLAGAAPSP